MTQHLLIQQQIYRFSDFCKYMRNYVDKNQTEIFFQTFYRFEFRIKHIDIIKRKQLVKCIKIL